MEFRTKDLRLEQVFTDKNMYEVPNFQRDFSWQEKQYDDFILDVKKSVRLSFNESNNKIEFNTEEVDYFFGTILLVGDGTKPNVEKPYKVIDGQQRLTTMTLFLACIKDIIDEYNEDKDSEDKYAHEYDSNLFFSYSNFGKTSKKTRLVNKNLNPILPFDILKIEGHNASEEKASNVSQDTLRKSFDFIKGKLLKEYLLKGLGINDNNTEWNDISYITYIDSLGKQLLNSTVICIYSLEERDVNKIYQNFNSKGLRLSDIDLIKSRIFEVLDDEYDETSRKWNYITDTVYSINENISDFFYYFLNSIGINTNQTKLFETFSNKIKENEYVDFLDNCKKHVDFYKVICNPSEDDSLFQIKNYFNQKDNFIVKKNLEILKISGYSQFRMAFLSLFNAMNDRKIKSKQFKSIIALVTKYNVLNSIKAEGYGSTTNKIQAIYKKMAKKFNEETLDTSSLNLFIKKQLDTVKPGLESIKQSAKVFDKGDKIKGPKDLKPRDLAKYILVTLEIERIRLDDKNTANKALKYVYDLSIEHIVDRKNHNELGDIVYDLGNLVLLENTEHSNSTDKKSMYENSNVNLIKDLRDNIENFEEKNITERHDKLLEEFYNLVTK